MAELTIRLVSNRASGKRDIYIDYDSEEDALPIEHEREHRALVERLLGEGVLTAEQVGEIHVRRAPQGAAEARGPAAEAPPKPEASGEGA